jgi:hypothetical protein
MADDVWNEGKQITCGKHDGIMLHGAHCGSCMGVCLWFEGGRQQLPAALVICSQFQQVSSVVRYGVVYVRAMCTSFCMSPT